MPKWRIYYSDKVVEGATQDEWVAAPDDDVQVIVLFEAPPSHIRWHYFGGLVEDRQLWTGEDTFDPFGWGVKRGALIEKEAYFKIWNKACGDS